MISDSNQVPGISLKRVKKKTLTQFYLPSSICYIHNKSIGNHRKTIGKVWKSQGNHRKYKKL